MDNIFEAEYPKIDNSGFEPFLNPSFLLFKIEEFATEYAITEEKNTKESVLLGAARKYLKKGNIQGFIDFTKGIALFVSSSTEISTKSFITEVLLVTIQTFNAKLGKRITSNKHMEILLPQETAIKKVIANLLPEVNQKPFYIRPNNSKR